MAYTDIDKPSDYFTTFLRVGVYAGSGTTDFNIGFKPDLVWDKNRTATSNHDLIDSVRGGGINLNTNDNSADATGANVTSFLSNGFQITNYNDWGSNRNIVDWCWKAGTSFTNDASATGIGTIDSTGSVNTDAGFSIISYTGNASASQSVAHGLGVAPKIVLVKPRNQAYQWLFQTTQIDGSYDYLYLNQTDAKANLSVSAPTSTVFNLSNSDAFNGSGDSLIAYCFAEKKGYSKFGSYTGNGSTNGSYIHLGFKPAFFLIKNTNDGTDDWHIMDNKRNGYNPQNNILQPNLNDAEGSSTRVDFLSNGVKINSSSAFINGSGETIIYMAFAEQPFVTSTGVPATAR